MCQPTQTLQEFSLEGISTDQNLEGKNELKKYSSTPSPLRKQSSEDETICNVHTVSQTTSTATPEEICHCILQQNNF